MGQGSVPIKNTAMLALGCVVQVALVGVLCVVIAVFTTSVRHTTSVVHKQVFSPLLVLVLLLKYFLIAAPISLLVNK